MHNHIDYSNKMRKLIRDLWTRMMLRDIQYSDRFSRFDQLYRVENPWHMDNGSEKFRFEETNRLIRSHLGRVNSILEIGCGEGHQTIELAKLSDKIYGIDISTRAIERARLRYPQGIFDVGDVFQAPILKSVSRFDLVVACEVLYYNRDISGVLARMEQLGNACFVTYVSSQHPELAAPLECIRGRQATKFEHNSVSWYAVWWSVQPNRQRPRLS